MASGMSASVVRQIGSLYEGGSVAGMSDRELLDRFNAGRDAAGEAAFAALVARHGPMVLNIGSALAARSTSAAVSNHLCETTAGAALAFAVGKSAGPGSVAAGLACEVVRSMMYHRLKIAVLTMLLLGAVATGVGFAGKALAGRDGAKGFAGGVQTPDDANAKPAPGRMFVVGRVVDPDGKPVPGATVTASVQAKFSQAWSALARPVLDEIGHISADESGRFRVDAPRTSSSRHDAFVAIALAPGFGVGWVKVDPDADQPTADIKLEPEQVIEGRVFDVQCRPAQGVTVSVASIEHQSVHASETRTVEGVVEGPIYDWTRVNDLPAWPKPATTDAEGRFAIHGVGRGVKVGLSVIDPRFALDVIDVETDNAAGVKTVTATLEPGKIFTGRVTDAETGKPVPHARLRFSADSSLPQRWFFRHTQFQADADGRFRGIRRAENTLTSWSTRQPERAM